MFENALSIYAIKIKLPLTPLFKSADGFHPKWSKGRYRQHAYLDKVQRHDKAQGPCVSMPDPIKTLPNCRTRQATNVTVLPAYHRTRYNLIFSPQSCYPRRDYIAPSTHLVLGYPFRGESTYITTSSSMPENGRYRENAFTAGVAVKAHRG